jgi:hypothetical protein
MQALLLTKKASQNNEAGGGQLAWWKKTTVLFALGLACMVASACRGKQASLEDRVKAYWDARIKGQVEQTYEFEAPGSMDKEAYLQKMRSMPVAFRKSTIESIKESGDEAEVKLRQEFLLPGLSRSASSSMLDKWVKVRGRWYHMLPPAGEDGASPEERR